MPAYTLVETSLFNFTSKEARQTNCLQKAFDGKMPKNNEGFGPIWQRIKIIIQANEVSLLKVKWETRIKLLNLKYIR
jgi:hypothetical protein